MDEIITLDTITSNRQALLAELHDDQRIIRDYVRGVMKGYFTGLYLHGPPGTAKTHTVERVLQQEGEEPYHHYRGHMTAGGLFESIAEHRDGVIVLDDVPKIFKCDVALQILLSALDTPTNSDRIRWVSWKQKSEEQRVCFQGGLICITNCVLHDDALLAAFKSRVHVFHYNPTDAQLGALMLDIASRGWSLEAGRIDVSSEDATAVAYFLIGELLRWGCRFDLRLLVGKALPLFLQWKECETESHWHDLIAASIKEHHRAVRHDPVPVVSRDARKEEEQNIVREILARHHTREERLAAWRNRTDKSDRAFYRRQAEIGQVTDSESVKLSQCHT